MSSLRKQLAVIHSKSTNELDLKAQKAAHAKSLLFEAKVAANQSMEIIYQLCHEGFDELCVLDDRFFLFERSIFGQQSKTEDRLQMTENENADLDAVIESFLGLVGARLMLKPAIKAVEWLIRRFRVLESNTEALVLTFLPYHTTPIFTTLLSILPKQLPPTLKFLHPHMAQLLNPTRRVIVYTASQNIGFFIALNHYVLNIARSQQTYHILLSFWASIMAQTISDMLESSASGRQVIQRQREEDLLIRILPVIGEGLDMRNVPELILGCYMLIAVLVSRASLNDRTLGELMIAVGKSVNLDTGDAALGCLAIIAEQRQTLTLMESVLKSALKMQNLADRLEKLATQQPAQRLTMGIAHGILNRYPHNSLSRDMPLLRMALQSPILNTPQKELLLQQISKRATDISADDHDAAELLQLLPDRRESNATVDDPDTAFMAIEVPMLVDTRRADDYPSIAQSAIMSVSSDLHVAEVSFLASDAGERFTKLLAVFEKILPFKSILQEFLDRFFLNRSDATGELAFFTFFMRVWTTSGSRNAKCCALQTTTEHVAEMRLSCCDLQAIIPYALHALGDSSKEVRQAAANLTAKLDEQLNSEPSNSKGLSVYWAKHLHGPSMPEVKWLSHKTIASFVQKVLLSGLEECVADLNHITQLIYHGLDGSSHSKLEDSEMHRERLKTTQRTEMFTYLCSEIISTPLYRVKLSLLSILNVVNKVGSHPRSKFLLPCVQPFIVLDAVQLATIQDEEGIKADDLYARVVEVVHPDDPEAIDFLLKLTETGNSGLQTLAFRRLHRLWPSLKRSRQKKITEDLVEASLQGMASATPSVRRGDSLATLRTITIAPEILVTLVEQTVHSINHEAQPPVSKKRRTSARNSITAGFQDETHQKYNIAHLTLVLELVEGSRGDPSLPLFYSLFEVLRVLQHHRAYTTSDLGYMQDLTLGSLSNMMKAFGRSAQAPKVDESLIRVDLLVDCIRNTTSIQARNLALLLLADLTRYAAKAVLDSIMPIFTLMSATTLHQTDEFSAHVVDQTIQQVVPLLSQTLRDQKQDLAAATAEILLSFAAAFEHIAPHRRLQLYAKLATSLGPSESLFAMLATLFDRFPGNTDVDRFSVSLFKQFNSKDCLTTVTKYLELVLDCLQPKPMLSRVLLRDDAGGNQSQSWTGLISAMLKLLKDATLRSKIMQDLANDEEALELRRLFGIAIEQTIRLSQLATQKGIYRAACAQLLECLLSLFPLDHLVHSVENLLDHPEQDIVRSVLKTLEVRMKTSKHAGGAAKAAMTRLLPQLTLMLRDENRPSLKLNALACIDQLCEKYGKTDPDATFRAVEAIASPHCMESPDQTLRVLSLHCLASSVEILQNDFIPLLQRSVQAAISNLHGSLADSATSQKLQNAAYAFFTALADHVPFMVGRASLRTILEASHSSANAHIDQHVRENRLQFLQLAATRLDISIVLDVSKEVWTSAVRQGPQALQEQIDMLKTTIENHSRGEISRNTRSLFELLLDVLDIRRTCTDNAVKHLYPEKQREILEKAVLALVISVVLKINDTLFRPFFAQMLEWSTNALPKRELVGKTLRSITFFNLTAALSERLKSIFTLYFGDTLERVKEILMSNAPTDISDQALKIAVIRALSSSFKYDQDDFWQAPAHFDVVLDPLVSQLSMQAPSLVTSEVIPAITELSVAAASNDHHRDLNRSLLKALKGESPRVRLAAVKCQESLARRLGDEWLGHLPEMLPVINELQDDDDEAVERETHRWIQLIEETLGESLNSMLQ